MKENLLHFKDVKTGQSGHFRPDSFLTLQNWVTLGRPDIWKWVRNFNLSFQWTGWRVGGL